MGRHLLCKQTDVGSKPIPSTKFSDRRLVSAEPVCLVALASDGGFMNQLAVEPRAAG